MSDCYKIADNLWHLDDSVNALSSSDAIDHPVTNLLKQSVSKVWRSGGFFKIVASSNDSLDFSEGGGELNAIITPGNYLVSELELEIKARMEALGAETYTVSFNTSDGKWTISNAGGSLSLLWDSGSNSANTIGVALGYDTSIDDTSANTYTGSGVALHTEESITLDLGTWGTNSVDFASVVFDPETGPQFTSGATLRIQANQTLNFTSPALDVAAVIDEDFTVITHFFSAPESYRYWRFKIVDPGNPDLYVEVPKFIVGSYLGLTQPPSIGFKDPINDRTRVSANDFGNEYFDILPNQRRYEFNFVALSEADKLLLKQMYRTHGKSKPIAMVLDPSQSTFSNKDESFLYARLDNSYQSAQSFYTYFDLSMVVREVL